jgi:hypothetical protein
MKLLNKIRGEHYRAVIWRPQAKDIEFGGPYALSHGAGWALPGLRGNDPAKAKQLKGWKSAHAGERDFLGSGE